MEITFNEFVSFSNQMGQSFWLHFSRSPYHIYIICFNKTWRRNERFCFIHKSFTVLRYHGDAANIFNIFARAFFVGADFLWAISRSSSLVANLHAPQGPTLFFHHREEHSSSTRIRYFCAAALARRVLHGISARQHPKRRSTGMKERKRANSDPKWGA